jgi:hypothetical protein
MLRPCLFSLMLVSPPGLLKSDLFSGILGDPHLRGLFSYVLDLKFRTNPILTVALRLACGGRSKRQRLRYLDQK